MKKICLISIVALGCLAPCVSAETVAAATVGPSIPASGSAAPPTTGAMATPAAPAAPSSQAANDFRLFAVYSGRPGRPGHYIPSGYMGDNTLLLSGAFVPTHDGQGNALKVTYTGKGAKGWAGLYWQHPANNWGDKPGSTGFNLNGARRLTFWARGEKGGEKIHEVRVGGIVGRYPDSDVVTMGPITLTKEWKPYAVDLSGKNLQHIIGGFAVSMSKRDNTGETVFYLDDIGFEVPVQLGLPAVNDTVEETTPAKTGIDPKAAEAVAKESKSIDVKPDESGLRVSFSSQFLFAPGQTALQPTSSKVLNEVIEILKAYPTNDVLLEGHTDNLGNADYNLALSKLRAEHVKDYLIKNGGFDPARFRVVGYGQTQPIATNKTRAGRAQNRRVEVIILKKMEKM